MRILITSILCQTGLMTHVQDLVNYLDSQGHFVAIAFQKVNYLNEVAEDRIFQNLGTIPYLVYDTQEELKRFFLQQNCHLIHAHSHATFEAATEISRCLEPPLVVTLHSVFPWKRIFKSTLQLAATIIAVGPAQARSARGFNHKIEIIQNGIDTKLFVPSKQLDASSKKFNVLWYGRVDGRLARGLRILDQMAPLLPSNIKITALGTADFQPVNIPAIPWVENPIPFLQQSQITFAHSRSLREAMSCGSIGMLIGYGYGGMVTEQRLHNNLILDAFPEYPLPKPQPTAILNDLLQIVNSGDVENLRLSARMIAEKHFAIEDMGKQVLAIYRKVLGGSSMGN